MNNNRLRDRPTHAGGVVYRMHDGRVEFLVTTAKRRPDEWVLPKGHIESGETAEEAAVREVAEETGTRAAVEGALGETTLVINNQEQRILFFLMRLIDEGSADEGRSVRWLPAPQALEQLTFPSARELVQRASIQLQGRSSNV